MNTSGNGNTVQESPIAAGEIAILDTPYSAPQQMRNNPKKKTVMIICFILGILGTIFVAVLLISLITANNANQTSEEQPSGGTLISKLDFETIDLKKADYPEAEGALTYYIQVKEIYKGCVTEAGQVDADCAVSKLDASMAEDSIDDPEKITLANIEKANIYLMNNNTDAAWRLLSGIEEDNLLESQRHSYYLMMLFYSDAIGDAENILIYREKLDGASYEEMG